MSKRIWCRVVVATLVTGAVSLFLSTRFATAQPSAAPGVWTAPRTGWGVPDLQGIWTNATLTPIERPDALADKTVLTAEEAAELEVRSAEQREASDRFIPGNVGAYNQFWMDGGKNVTGDRRTSLIVDPPDGKIPWTSAGRRRLESDLARYGVGPFNSWEDADTGERCLTDGLPLVPLQGYNMNYHILQSPGWVLILNEMFHEYRLIPVDGRAHLPSAVGQMLGRCAGPVGRRYAGGRNHELRRQGPLPLARDVARHADGPTSGGAIHPHRRRNRRLRVHDDRPRDVHPAVDSDPADDHQPGLTRRHRRTDVRIRLPRRQLRPAEHHAGRSGAGSRPVARAIPASVRRCPAS